MLQCHPSKRFPRPEASVLSPLKASRPLLNCTSCRRFSFGGPGIIEGQAAAAAAAAAATMMHPAQPAEAVQIADCHNFHEAQPLGPDAAASCSTMVDVQGTYDRLPNGGCRV